MDATLCILAGGEARRMGQPKAELRVRGQPMLAYLFERFRWPGPTMLVTAPSRRSPPGAELFDREVIDPVDGQGPLCGIRTALQNVETPRALFASIDMPLVEHPHLDWLLREFDGNKCGLMLRYANHVQPFPSIFRVDALGAVSERFASGLRSVVALAHDGYVEVRDAPADWNRAVWTNLNTPEDFANFIDSTAIEPGAT